MVVAICIGRIEVNTKDGPTKQVCQDAILGELLIGQFYIGLFFCKALNLKSMQQNFAYSNDFKITNEFPCINVFKDKMNMFPSYYTLHVFNN